MKYIFVIYSCKKNITTKAKPLFYMLQNKLPNCKIYICYGQEDLDTDYRIMGDEDTHLVLKCNDGYETLSIKTITLLNVIEKIHPNSKGVFKCDDDILPNILDLKRVLERIDTQDIPYLGKVIDIQMDNYTNYYINIMQTKKYRKPLLVHQSKYAAGPLYYISMKSISVFNKLPVLNDIRQEPIDYMFEDNMVGYLLNQSNIFPVQYNMYYDHIIYFHQGSVQNIKNRINNIYVYLRGGIGNQLFQVAAGFELAKKYHMHMVLIYDVKVDEFLSTILSPFNSIALNKIDFSNVNIIPYKENESKRFCYNPIIIKNFHYYCLIGYFQHKNYLKEYKTEFIQLLQNDSLCNRIKTSYPLLSTSYFIHIRRGDYVNNALYTFDMDTYLKTAITFIVKKEKTNPHFYIVSDDMAYCKTCPLLDGIQKTFIENMSIIESLYIMSLCEKGGICSNSTFSGWATTLNQNPEKTVIVPKQWINVDYPYEIPFEYTVCF